MGTSIWDLFASLGLDSSEFTKGMDKAEKRAESGGQSITSNLSKVGGAVVLGAFAAASTAAVALGGFLASTIGPASDLNETMSKSSVVFGKYSFIVQEWGKTSADAMGMSQNSAVGAAATYGNLFRAMGMTEQVSSKMSMSLVELAGDLASFNNMNPDEVLQALRSGLSGETEPLKRLGVNLNQAAIEQQALTMKIWDGKGALTAAQKAQATYALIMQQTTLAQGDFARTSSGLANQQRILAANFENVKAKIGTALLPAIQTVMSKFIEFVSDPSIIAGIVNIATEIGNFATNVVTNIPNVLGVLQEVIAWFQANPAVVIAVLAGLGVAVLAFGITVATAAWTAMAPLIPVIAIMLAVGAVAYLLYQAWVTNFGGIQQIVAAVWAWLQPILLQIRDWLAVNIPIAIATLKAFWENVLLPAIQAVWQWVQANVFPIIVQLINWLQVNIPVAIQALSDFWTNVLLPAIQVVWQLIQKAVQDFLDWIQPVISAFQSAFEGDWRGFGEKLRIAWDELWKKVGEIASAAWEWLKGEIPKVITAIQDFFTKTDWGAIGKSILEGIANGIKNATGWLAEQARAAAQAALEAAKGFLGIQSPSKAFAEVGKNMMLGMAVGINDTSNIPERATEQAAQSVVNSADNRVFNFNYTGNATAGQVFQSYEMARLLE